MDVSEEENPLQIKTKTIKKVALHFKNNVGRPTKKDEVLFSAPPKSIISLLLTEEKDKKIQSLPTTEERHNALKEKTVKPSKEWSCEYCSERLLFYNKNEYKRHLLSHKAYKCDQPNCSYSTRFISNLKTHKRIHTSDYLYVCDECTFRTKFINSLKTHKRLHKTERPFACQHCEYKCNSQSNLKKHCTRKHSNIPDVSEHT